MRTAKPLLFALLLFALLSSHLPFDGAALPPARAALAQQPADFTVMLEPVVDGLNEPVLVTHARDGSRRLFIAELNGAIKVLQFGESQATVFLNLEENVTRDLLGGFLGLAFHPDHRRNGRFFVHYLRRDGVVITAEYRVRDDNPNIADPQSEKIILATTKLHDGHMGGSIEFGADGYLYVGLGDGSVSSDILNNGQNLDSLLGKILRLDVDNPSGGRNYSAPADNPFFGATAGRDEIYAYGFRNPYRFSFDAATGELYVGDVGESVKEEVNLVTAGGNYGWRVMEGTRCTGFDAPLCNTIRSLPPLIEYDHAGGRCSVTGGYVYRGNRATLPQGAYVYGDLCTGEIFVYDNGQARRLLDTGLFLTSFGIDEEGEIYVPALDGTIYRLVLSNPQDPQVELLTPDRKMKLKGNTTYEISWRTTGDGLHRHDILLSRDGGVTWEAIVGDLPGETRRYLWTVPNIKTPTARIRVVSYGSRSTGQDESAVDFVIKKTKGQ